MFTYFSTISFFVLLYVLQNKSFISFFILKYYEFRNSTLRLIMKLPVDFSASMHFSLLLTC